MWKEVSELKNSVSKLQESNTAMMKSFDELKNLLSAKAEEVKEDKPETTAFDKWFRG